MNLKENARAVSGSTSNFTPMRGAVKSGEWGVGDKGDREAEGLQVQRRLNYF
jgi:hypothetical protein